MIAVGEQNWIVDYMDFHGRMMKTRICYPTEPNLCASFLLIAESTGSLHIETSKTIPKRIRDDVPRWLRAFEQSFSLSKCYSDDALNHELRKWDAALPTSAPAPPAPAQPTQAPAWSEPVPVVNQYSPEAKVVDGGTE